MHDGGYVFDFRVVPAKTRVFSFFVWGHSYPLKCTRPWSGRVLVYGSMSLTTVLVIWIISLLGGTSSLYDDTSMGFAIAMAFVIIFIYNIGLIITSLIGRCCIAQDTTVAEASSESDEAAVSSSTATVVVVGTAS